MSRDSPVGGSNSQIPLNSRVVPANAIVSSVLDHEKSRIRRGGSSEIAVPSPAQGNPEQLGLHRHELRERAAELDAAVEDECLEVLLALPEAGPLLHRPLELEVSGIAGGRRRGGHLAGVDIEQDRPADVRRGQDEFAMILAVALFQSASRLSRSATSRKNASLKNWTIVVIIGELWRAVELPADRSRREGVLRRRPKRDCDRDRGRNPVGFPGDRNPREIGARERRSPEPPHRPGGTAGLVASEADRYRNEIENAAFTWSSTIGEVRPSADGRSATLAVGRRSGPGVVTVSSEG